MRPGIFATAVVWTITVVLAASVSGSSQGANPQPISLDRTDWSSLVGAHSISRIDVFIP